MLRSITCLATATALTLCTLGNAEAAFLGSFSHPQHGQDVLAAVQGALEALGSPHSAHIANLTLLYKNNENGSTNGSEETVGDASAFTTNYDTDVITQDGTPAIAGMNFIPMYYSSKNGNNGFNLYSWMGSPASFSNIMHSSGKLYDSDYPNNDFDSWGDANDPFVSKQKGTSHVSVWGVKDQPTLVPVPAPTGCITFCLVGLTFLGLRRFRLV